MSFSSSCRQNIRTHKGRLIGYAVGHIASGLPKWMYVFLIFGAFSLVTGVVALWLLPDLPSTAKLLTEKERAIAVERVAINRQGVKNQQFKWYQVWQAARDPKTWLLFIMAIGAQVPNSALTSVCLNFSINYENRYTDKNYSLHPSSSAPSDSIHWVPNIFRFQVARSSL